MKLRKLTTTDAWFQLDLDGVPGFGPVTVGPKVLQVNDKLRARAATYQLAVGGIQASGAAGSIKVTTEDRADAVGAFVAETVPLAAEGVVHPHPGWGISDDDLAELAGADPRHPLVRELREALTVEGVAAVARVALGGDPTGRTMSIGRLDPTSRAVADRLVAEGARVTAVVARGAGVVEQNGIAAERLAALATGDEQADGDGSAALGAEADLHLAAGGLRTVTHENEAAIGARHLLATVELAVTPRAMAQLARRDVTVWPEWLGTAGPAIAGHADHSLDADALVALVRDRITEVAADGIGHADGPTLAAAHVAEDFLRTWQDELPFGRPMP